MQKTYSITISESDFKNMQSATDAAMKYAGIQAGSIYVTMENIAKQVFEQNNPDLKALKK